ncbi:MAG: TonB-dependent receptor [Planctomycetes bacterium]|nr:TonB-dependent receptor [Planctomycetota bacterium]
MLGLESIGRIERFPLRRVAVLLLCVLGLASCTSLHRKLRPEHQIPILSKLGRDCDELPKRVTLVPTKPDGAGIELAIHEFGSDEHDRVVVAIHGVLSDYRCWRYVTGGIGTDFDVWAIDLPGCGDSDCPDPDSDPAAYSPTWMARHVLGALRSRLASREHPVAITLMCHSLGGAVGLRMLGDAELRSEYADVLDRVDGAVLIAPFDFTIGQTNPTFVELATLRDLKLALGTATGVLRRLTAKAIYSSGVDADRMPVEEFDRTYEILIDTARRRAMQAMLARAVPRDADGQIVWEAALELASDYENVDVPCLIIWGERDETILSASGYALRERIPDARLRLISECMHCVPIEEPLLCIELLRHFVADGLDDGPGVERLTRRPVMQVAWEGEQTSAASAKRESVTRRREQPVPGAPSSVTVLRGRDLTRSGARHLSDALRVVPGVEVQRISSTESGVAFRGYADSTTALQGTLGLVDGRQVYNQFLGNVLWDQLPVRLEDVKRIEVIRGPGSFIHGPNAMHGVVSIETKSPLEYEEDSVSTIAHAGNHGSLVIGNTVVGRAEGSGIKATAQWEDIDPFDPSTTSGQNKGFFETAFETELDNDPNHVLGLSGGFAQQEFDLLLPSLDVIPSSGVHSRSRDLFVSAHYRAGDPDVRSFEARTSWSGFNSESTTLGLYPSFGVDLDTFDIDLQSTWREDIHLLTIGLGYRHSTFETHDLDVSGGRHSVDQGWLFAQEEVRPTESLSLTLGLRGDGHSQIESSLSPRVALVWECTDDHFLRASAGRGFRSPSLRELWFDMPVQGVPGVPGTLTIGGNSDLDPESLTSFELGYSGAWGTLLGIAPGTIIPTDETSSDHQLELGVNGFFNRVDDLISFEPDPGDPTRVIPANQDDEDAYGFEVEGRYVFSDSMAVFANLTKVIRKDRATDSRNRLAPPHTANAGVTFSRFGFDAMLWTNYYDHTELFGIPIGSYVTVNGSVSYAFELNDRATGDVFLRVFNAFDDAHREHPEGAVLGRIVTAGVRIDW